MKPSCLRDWIVVLRLNRLDYVPTGLYSSELMVEGGYLVLAIEYGFFQTATQWEKGKIPRLRLGHPWLRVLPGPLRVFLLHTLAAVRVGFFFLKAGRPRLLIAEGLHEQAIAWFLSCVFPLRYAVHVHEVYEAKELRGWNRLFFVLERFALRKAAFTIFPEVTRRKLYRDRYKLENPSYLAFNCPRQTSKPTPINWRERLGLPSDAYLMGYWGGQGRNNFLEEGIRAVARTPRLTFLLWGWSSDEDRHFFQALASDLGIGHRVLFLGELPVEKESALAGLDLSYCLYKPEGLRLKHLATASNKLFESLAAGVPVLVRQSEDFHALVQAHDIGYCTGDSVAAIAETLQSLIDDRQTLRRQSANARACHEQAYYYERQFQPVLAGLNTLISQSA